MQIAVAFLIISKYEAYYTLLTAYSFVLNLSFVIANTPGKLAYQIYLPRVEFMNYAFESYYCEQTRRKS
jgi:hypothetical protein